MQVLWNLSKHLESCPACFWNRVYLTFPRSGLEPPPSCVHLMSWISGIIDIHHNTWPSLLSFVSLIFKDKLVT
jgi:hypothetical protein